VTKQVKTGFVQLYK